MPPDEAAGEARRAPEACPLCRSTQWTTLFEAKGHPIARCTGCGLVRTLAVESVGATRYPPFDQRDAFLTRALRALFAQLLRERIAACRRMKSSGRLLDFGCGSGAFARLASRSGYDVVGIEPFSLGAPFEAPGLRLIRGALEDAPHDLGRFDLVTLWQVLEHVPDPRAVLSRLRPHLAPDGVLLVSVPNLASWQSRVFGARWFHLDPPRHVTHFDEARLRRLLADSGFEVARVRTFHLEYGLAGWVQSALNLLLARENFAYELVKDRGALADMGRGELAWTALLTAAAGAGVTLPALALECIAGLAGAGSVLTAEARLLSERSSSAALQA